jgi:hypothetical integral membrane protein (TIGR02206 family)
MFLSNVEFYKDGFFGYGEKGDFKYFSFWHFLPIIILIAAIILTYIYRKKLASFKHEKYVRFILGCAILLFEAGYYWRLLYVGAGDSESTTLLTKLPFQICEWTAIFAALMLFVEYKTLFDIDVFVCLTLGIVPLITPAVITNTGPLYFRYYQFFGEHILPIYAVFYMMFVRGFKYDLKTIYKPIIFLVILVIISIILNNNIKDANYLYLASKTKGESLANILPKNMYLKLLIYVGCVFFLFGCEYGIFRLSFYLANKIRNKKEATNIVKPCENNIGDNDGESNN